MLTGLKDCASNLEATSKKKMAKKRLSDLVNKCADSQNRLHKSISIFEKSVDNIVEVYQFYHKWLESTQGIQG